MREWPKEVTTHLAPATDDEIRAVVALKALRFHRRGRMPVTVDVLSQQGIESSQRGRAKELIRDMAADPTAPLVWRNKSLGLVRLRDLSESELEELTRSWVLDHGSEDDLPWFL